MIVLLFKEIWVEPIRSGRKVQTIRSKRVYPIKVGDQLSLRHWLGKPPRSKQEILLDLRCTSVHTVKMTADEVSVDDMPLTSNGVMTFAERDGFEWPSQMFEFFRNMHGLPFEGDVIGWD